MYQSDQKLYGMLRGAPQEREAAFRELYARHSSRVYLYCRKVMGPSEIAEDIFQQTFLRFLQSAETERVMTNLPAYLLRIARNLCLNHRKKMGNMTVPLEEFRSYRGLCPPWIWAELRARGLVTAPATVVKQRPAPRSLLDRLRDRQAP